MYLTENEDFDFKVDIDNILWKEKLVYGNWYDGPNGDGTRSKLIRVEVPDQVQQNGTWYIHVFVVRSGHPLDPDEKGYSEQAISYQSKCE